jgi:hypothetical protein
MHCCICLYFVKLFKISYLNYKLSKYVSLMCQSHWQWEVVPGGFTFHMYGDGKGEEDKWGMAEHAKWDPCIFHALCAGSSIILCH